MFFDTYTYKVEIVKSTLRHRYRMLERNIILAGIFNGIGHNRTQVDDLLFDFDRGLSPLDDDIPALGLDSIYWLLSGKKHFPFGLIVRQPALHDHRCWLTRHRRQSFYDKFARWWRTSFPSDRYDFDTYHKERYDEN